MQPYFLLFFTNLSGELLILPTREFTRILHNGELVLDKSSIVGDVESDQGSNVILQDSTIAGEVIYADRLELENSRINSATDISTLVSKDISQISAQFKELKVCTLILGGGSLTVGTTESHDVDVTMRNLTVDASTVLKANMVLKDAAQVRFANDAVATLGCTLTLMGNVDIMLLDEPALATDDSRILMEGVDDVLLAGGQDVRRQWRQYSDKDVWYTDLYEAHDNQGTMFYTTDSATPGATLSRLSLVYDNAITESQGARIGQLLIKQVQVPEPTTGTLSLLALAALAARRRRKR